MVFRKIRFIGSVSLLYLLTIGTVGVTLQHSQLFGTPVHADTKKQQPNVPVTPRFVLVSGTPIRITVPDYAIDLPIDAGEYDSNTGAWTLSDTRAQFAVMAALPNNFGGNTFIYGHGTDIVFGKLGATTPLPGTIAQIYTDNGHVFTYRFQESHSVTPNDTAILAAATDGPPRMTIQTCTGVFSEWRTMFTFTFEKVEKA